MPRHLKKGFEMEALPPRGNLREPLLDATNAEDAADPLTAHLDAGDSNFSNDPFAGFTVTTTTTNITDRHPSTASFEEGMLADTEKPAPQLQRPRSMYTSFDDRKGDGSSGWRRRLCSTKPVYGSAGLVTIKSAVLCLIVVPLVMLSMGCVIDTELHGDPFFFHSTCLFALSYVVAPFTLTFANWPRQQVFNRHLAKGSRVLWDVCISVACLACMHLYAQSLATSSPQTAFVYQTLNTMFDGYHNVVDKPTFWKYIKEELASTMWPSEQTCPSCKMVSTFNSDFNSSAICPTNWSRTLGPDPSGLPPATFNITCPSTINMDVPIPQIAYSWTGVQIRQVRVNQELSSTYPTAGTYIYPPFKLGTENTSTWGQGASWLQRFPSTADLVAAAESAIHATYRCSCTTAGVMRPLAMNQSLVQIPAPAGRESPGWNTPAEMTWPKITTALAWYYTDGGYHNLYGRRVDPPDTLGPTHIVSYPAGGFTWSIPTAAWGFTRQGVIQAAEILEEQQWIDEQTRFVFLSFTAISGDTGKWGMVGLMFEFSAPGTVQAGFTTSFGNLASAEGVAANDNHWPRGYVNFYFYVFSFTLYYICAVAIRAYEHGGFLVMVQREMIRMDIATQLLVLASWILLLWSTYLWPGSHHNPESDHGILGFQNEKDLIETAFLWQDSRDFIGIAVILQWLRFIEYLMLVPKLGTVPRAIVLGVGTVAYFLCTMVMVMAAFISGFTIIYSSTTTAFANSAQSLLTLWSALLGNVDVDNFIQSRYFVGIILFFFFSFFTLFVFLTMLFGLIGDAYDQAKDEAAEAEKQVSRLVHEETPAVKALVLKIEGYFEHFRSIDNLDGSKDGPTESADSDDD